MTDLDKPEIKNIFVLCAGRCGSKTFIKACEHITNFSSAHESRVSKLGDDRVNYPLYHIEADNRLSWFLGRLDNKYRDQALYVHLSRNPKRIAESYNLRWPYYGTIVKAYANGILMSKELSINPCVDYVRTVSENITHFLRDKTKVINIDIDSPRESFLDFWERIGAEGDLEAALSEFDLIHNQNLLPKESVDHEVGAGDVVSSLERVINLSYEERRHVFGLVRDKEKELVAKESLIGGLKLSVAEHEIRTASLKSDIQNLESTIEKLNVELCNQRETSRQLDEMKGEHSSLVKLVDEYKLLADKRGEFLSKISKEVSEFGDYSAKTLSVYNGVRSEYERSVKLANSIKASTSYRLGHALVKNVKSPLRWFLIPVEIVKAFTSNSNDAQEVLPLEPIKNINLRLVDRITSLNSSKKHNKVILEAGKIARDSIDEAAEYVSLMGGEGDLNSFNVLRANDCLSSGSPDKVWLHYMNGYLAKGGLSKLTLNGGQGSLFDRIDSNVAYKISDPTKVSVIMPVFNARSSVRKAAESILKQTWQNIQLILIDDRSTDGSWDVVQRLAEEDDRVVALRNPVNVGPYVSKNRALKYVNGDYITGQDADDWSHPQRIELQLQALRSSDGALATISHMLRVTPAGEVTQLMAIGKTSYDGVARLCSISAMFDFEFFKERLGAWDSVRFGADSELIERSRTLLGGRLVVQKQINMVCQDVEGSLTNNPETGVRVNGQGLSPVRVKYRESWVKWHAQIFENPGVDCALKAFGERMFDAPKQMQVPKADILKVHESD